MRYNQSDTINKQTIEKLRYDFYDMSYYVLMMIRKTQMKDKIESYEIMKNDIFTGLTYIEVIKQGNIDTQDLMVSMQNYLINLHSILVLIVDEEMFQGECYDTYIATLKEQDM